MNTKRMSSIWSAIFSLAFALSVLVSFAMFIPAQYEQLSSTYEVAFSPLSEQPVHRIIPAGGIAGVDPNSYFPILHPQGGIAGVDPNAHSGDIQSIGGVANVDLKLIH